MSAKNMNDYKRELDGSAENACVVSVQDREGENVWWGRCGGSSAEC